MHKVYDAIEKHAEAKEAYRAFADEERERKLRALHEEVKATHRAVSEAIVEGAKPCPTCGKTPHGIRHEVGRGKMKWVEFEVGCLDCKPFEHMDGTTRRHAARGGLLPRHTVEAWNAGPDLWVQVAAEAKAEP